jgi:hypothetical protein
MLLLLLKKIVKVYRRQQSCLFQNKHGRKEIATDTKDDGGQRRERRFSVSFLVPTPGGRGEE